MHKNIVDSHCHMQYYNKPESLIRTERYHHNWQEVWNHAKKRGITKCLNIFELSELKDTNNIIKEMGIYKDEIYIAIGLHPLAVRNYNIISLEDDLETIIKYAHAIGETGLDIKKDNNLDDQITALKIHIKLANKYKLPLVIHSRDVDIEILYNLLLPYEKLVFVLHCCTYDMESVQKIIQLPGAYVSFSGILTYASASYLKDTYKSVPLERLLFETDSPYLTPNNIVMHGTKIDRYQINNKPAYVYDIYKFAAQLLQMDTKHLIDQVYKNFRRFINYDQPLSQ